MLSSSSLTQQEVRRAQKAGAMAAVLKQIRTTRVRAPEAVVELGRAALSSRRLGDEVWNVREQTLIAALDVDDIPLAKACESAILDRFGDTGARASRLKGLTQEARGDLEEAAQTYATMLESNGANAAALKREICLAKMQGDVASYVEKLKAYLERFQSDRSAWQALAETYVSSGNLPYAIFCYEELTLFEPTAAHYHCRLGELHYTDAGGLAGPKRLDALLKARKYFAHCVELATSHAAQAKSARAPTGLLLTCSAVGEIKPDDELNVALSALAAAHLKSIYKSHAAPSDLVAKAIAPFVANHTPPFR
ncbi:hypothetical protein CTAYLR_003867 [Chrysophaeum taylorii]|uniref:ER membrane protein complex subunit 2 n=1 Tax=Chrysophaeum taylorii TaxID=2483200 RepID=A0AAD7ULP7_9STRA|nr:hypothetical protein CTAYLR_003867 [Chrysophaeum taylorii]